MSTNLEIQYCTLHLTYKAILKNNKKPTILHFAALLLMHSLEAYVRVDVLYFYL